VEENIAGKDWTEEQKYKFFFEGLIASIETYQFGLHFLVDKLWIFAVFANRALLRKKYLDAKKLFKGKKFHVDKIKDPFYLPSMAEMTKILALDANGSLQNSKEEDW
jgi:hypothetical protein